MIKNIINFVLNYKIDRFKPKGGGIMEKKAAVKKWFFREEENEDDIDFYSREVREAMLDDDELSTMEEAFMNGYDDAA